MNKILPQKQQTFPTHLCMHHSERTGDHTAFFVIDSV